MLKMSHRDFPRVDDTMEPIMAEKTVTRETAIDALRCLATADALILDVIGSSNGYRNDTIAEMENQLGVKVSTTPA